MVHVVLVVTRYIFHFLFKLEFKKREGQRMQAHIYLCQQYSSLVRDRVSVDLVDKFVILSQEMKCFTKVVSLSVFQHLELALSLQHRKQVTVLYSWF